jgi:hypothetical protein
VAALGRTRGPSRCSLPGRVRARAQERDAESVEIPNIRWPVFEAMMRFVYTGQLDVAPDIALELLQASDMYLLEGLKRLCENAIATSLTADSVIATFEYSEQFSAPALGRRCLLYVLGEAAAAGRGGGSAAATARAAACGCWGGSVRAASAARPRRPPVCAIPPQSTTMTCPSCTTPPRSGSSTSTACAAWCPASRCGGRGPERRAHSPCMRS